MEVWLLVIGHLEILTRASGVVEANQQCPLEIVRHLSDRSTLPSLGAPLCHDMILGNHHEDGEDALDENELCQRQFRGYECGGSFGW